MPTSPSGPLDPASLTIQAGQSSRSRRQDSRARGDQSYGESDGVTRDGDDSASLRGGSNPDPRKGKKRKRVLTGKLYDPGIRNVKTQQRPRFLLTGCLTCRRRKVKCGESHPVCEQCSRLHLHCEWGKSLGPCFHTIVVLNLTISSATRHHGCPPPQTPSTNSPSVRSMSSCQGSLLVR
jgi:hypothetical protein